MLKRAEIHPVLEKSIPKVMFVQRTRSVVDRGEKSIPKVMFVQRTRSVVDRGCVTPPREIHPNTMCFLTVRAVNRSFRFVPNARVTATIRFCLAVALEKFSGKIAAHEFLFMSNHFHLVITDITGSGPAFSEFLDSLLSRALNSIRGISGTNIEKGYNRVVVHEDEKLVDHCVYTLTNPCKANLVARSRRWKGASSLDLEYGVPISVERPKFGLWAGKLAHAERKASQRSKRAEYAGRWKTPKSAEFVLSRPAVMTDLSDAELRAHIRRRVDATELELMRERKQKNWRVLGWKRVVAQHFLDIPRPEEQFGMSPNFSGSFWARVETAQRRSIFIAAYYAAIEAFRTGDLETKFPIGTWLMKRRFGLACCPIPSG